jgi:putative acetyltransferase
MIEIRPLQPDEIPAARRVMCEVCIEIWGMLPTAEEFEQNLIEAGEFDDIYNVESYYFGDNGIFLAVVDDDRVVGIGAIRRLREEICELRRMWILKDYRAQGWGKVIAEELLRFARIAGYERVRLEVYDPPMQARAVAFYMTLGFYEIPPYKESPAKLYMEKLL